MSQAQLIAIEKEIRRLHERANAIRDDYLEEYAEEISSCKWVRGIAFAFLDFGFDTHCGNTYALRFDVNEPVLWSKLSTIPAFFPLYGNDPSYQRNITLRKHDYGWSLETDNELILCQFLEEFKPRITPCSLFDRRFKLFQQVRVCQGLAK